MNRRDMLKQVAKAGAGSLIVAGALSQSACAAKDVVIAQVQAAIAMVQGLLSTYGSYLAPATQAILSTILTQFNSLLGVVQSTTGNAIQYIAAIIPLIDQVLAALPVGVIPPLVQTAIVVGLGVVQSILRFLGNSLLHPPTAGLGIMMKKALAPGTQQEIDIVQQFLDRAWK